MVQAIVSDSGFDSAVMVQIQLTKYKDDSTFRFVSQTFVSSVTENKTVDRAVVVVNPIGYEIGQRLRFRILNPTREFEIGEISGIITVPKGVIFDREKQAFYTLHVEAYRMSSPQVVARTMVNVTIEDINDNPPVFEQKRFYKAIDIDNNIGALLLSVTATDADVGENAKIRYITTPSLSSVQLPLPIVYTLLPIFLFFHTTLLPLLLMTEITQIPLSPAILF